MMLPTSRFEVEYTPAQVLGKRMRKARTSAGFTQKELASHIGRLTTYVQGVELGIDDMDPMTQWRWLAACGEYATPPEELPINANVVLLAPTNPAKALSDTVPVDKWQLPLHRDILRAARKYAHLSQPKLGKLLDRTASYICQVERGKCGITAALSLAWMRACGL